jgi:hypothetical protein
VVERHDERLVFLSFSVVEKHAELVAGHRSVVDVRPQKATGFSALQRGRETSRIGGWASLRRGRKTQKATGFPALQRGRETQRANGHSELRRAVEIRSRTILDEADRKYGFQRACSALPTLMELRCGHDDCQQPFTTRPRSEVHADRRVPRKVYLQSSEENSSLRVLASISCSYSSRRFD